MATKATSGELNMDKESGSCQVEKQPAKKRKNQAIIMSM